MSKLEKSSGTFAETIGIHLEKFAVTFFAKLLNSGIYRKRSQMIGVSAGNHHRMMKYQFLVRMR